MFHFSANSPWHAASSHGNEFHPLLRLCACVFSQDRQPLVLQIHPLPRKESKIDVFGFTSHSFPQRIRPRLYGKKLSRVEGSPAYPSYPGRANFSYISLQNLANRLHEKQKVGSARRVTRLAGLPFCDGRVTLLAGPTFLHINTLARLAGSTRSRRDDQSMRELCCYWKVSSWLGQRGQLYSHINAR